MTDWITFLREEKLWGSNDPLFPKTRVGVDPESHFAAQGLERDHWSSAGPIRRIFRETFERAGLP